MPGNMASKQFTYLCSLNLRTVLSIAWTTVSAQETGWDITTDISEWQYGT